MTRRILLTQIIYKLVLSQVLITSLLFHFIQVYIMFLCILISTGFHPAIYKPRLSRLMSTQLWISML